MPVERKPGFIPAEYELESDLADQLSRRPGAQRCVIGEAELLLVVHEVPEAGVPEREPLVFWRNAEHEWLGPDGRKGLRKLSSLMARYEDSIDDYEARLENAEEAKEIFQTARHAGPLARSARNLAKAISEGIDEDDDDRLLISNRDRAREIERAAELLYQDARLTLEFVQSERAEEQQEATERLNTIVYRLNLMAGFFLPMVALAGLLGMNVNVPEFLLPFFWAVVCAGLMLGALVLMLVSWRTKDR